MSGRASLVALLVIALVGGFAGTVGGGHPTSMPSVRGIDADRLKSLLERGQKLVLVDVRSVAEFEKGHIPGAQPLSEDEPGERLRWLPKAGEAIVLYCTCPVSEISPAYQYLRFLGYRDVLVLDGGLGAWIARGYPLAK